MTDKTPTPQSGVLTLGKFALTETGVQVAGKPTFDNFEQAWAWSARAAQASQWWLVDLLAYAETRQDWAERLSQVIDASGVSAKRMANLRTLRSIPPSRRRDDVDISLHEDVVALPPDEQDYWLEKAAERGYTQRELRMEIRASKRRRVIEGQARLEGQYRVVLADPPWQYGDRPPSGSGAEAHYPTMSMADLMKMPVAAHLAPDAVCFLWVTAPMLLLNPGPRDVLEAWGLQYKTGMVWHKARHNFGHYVSVRHEHVLIATRGSCLPDRPTPMVDSVFTTSVRTLAHSEKPPELRAFIEKMYDGPYLELFARERVKGWAAFGNDARLVEGTR